MHILGLKYGIVNVVPYRDEWAVLYKSEKVMLDKVIGDMVLDIQHVGSTSVKGLVAKPIIDIAIAYRNKTIIPEISEKLEKAGYIDRGDAGKNGGYIFVKECDPWVRTFHIHFVNIKSEEWKKYLYFRDVLRKDKKIRDEYTEVKRNLMSKFKNNRKEYTFIRYHAG